MNRLTGLLLLNVLIGGGTVMASDKPDEKVLTLQEAIRLALARAPEVSLATAQAERAAQALRETRSLNLPQVTTGTGAAYNNGFPLSIEGAAPSIVQIGMSQSILSTKNKNLIKEAEESSKAVQLAPEAARNELAARTALVYYQLYQGHRLSNLWNDRLQAYTKEQQIAESLLEAGKVKPVDVTQAKTATAQARQQLLVADEQVKMAEVELRDLTGIPEGTPIRTEEPRIDDQMLEQPAEDLYKRALETHPDILQAEAGLRAKEFHVEAEKAESRPRIEVISQYALFSRTNNYQDFFNKFTRNNFIFGLSVQVPIFNGHRTSARVAESTQEVAEARFRLERMRSDLKLSLERSLSALRIARGAADLANREVAASRESLQVNETLLQGGRIGEKELQSSQSQLREKEIDLLSAEQTVFQREIDLLRLSNAMTSLY